ncbi:hypothetical protein CRU79_24630 [Escherichia sp. E4385]|nr:hypothetical protein CRU79_24630 [Escherichia sp. E4385]
MHRIFQLRNMNVELWLKKNTQLRTELQKEQFTKRTLKSVAATNIAKKKYDSSPTVQSYVIDVNENTRYEWMERCMQQRGWVSEVKVLM